VDDIRLREIIAQHLAALHAQLAEELGTPAAVQPGHLVVSLRERSGGVDVVNAWMSVAICRASPALPPPRKRTAA
jgi:hypothetical protein